MTPTVSVKTVNFNLDLTFKSDSSIIKPESPSLPNNMVPNISIQNSLSFQSPTYTTKSNMNKINKFIRASLSRTGKNKRETSEFLNKWSEKGTEQDYKKSSSNETSNSARSTSPIKNFNTDKSKRKTEADIDLNDESDKSGIINKSFTSLGHNSITPAPDSIRNSGYVQNIKFYFYSSFESSLIITEKD